MNWTEVLGLAASMVVAFTVTAWLTPWWIRVARARGLVGKDMNKPGNVVVAEAGGVWAIIGTVFGLLFLEAWHIYLQGKPYAINSLFALTLLLLLSAFLGFLDDILGWKKGLPRWQRIVFMAPISLPLVVVKAGHSTIALPLVGVVDLGLLYPLLAVPIGVLGAANAFNMIAGFNGLEAGMGLLLMFFTAVYAYMKHVAFVPEAALVMASAIIGFLLYNWYPARVFPGNAFTYGVGAYYAALVIIGNMEKFGLLLFTPYFIELALFIRGLFNGVYKENFGVPQSDGSLVEPYPKHYSLTHVAITIARRFKGKAFETDVVAVILLVEAIVGLAAITLAYLKLL